MLLLTRKAGEKILIGENIEIIVLGSRHNQAKIGINAPKDVNIRRSELPPLEKKP